MIVTTEGINQLIQELKEQGINPEVTEVWVDIKGFEGKYQISSFGRVKSLPKLLGRPYQNRVGIRNGSLILSANFNSEFNPKAYPRVNLGRKNTRYVHKLVAEAFLPNTYNKPTINHKDGNKGNCKLSNLEWATYKENNNHAYKLGLNKPQLQNLIPFRK